MGSVQKHRYELMLLKALARQFDEPELTRKKYFRYATLLFVFFALFAANSVLTDNKLFLLANAFLAGFTLTYCGYLVQAQHQIRVFNDHISRDSIRRRIEDISTR